MFLKDVWYVAELSANLGRDILRREICGQWIAFYRKLDGSVAAIEDRCSHRFAPLSRGTLEGDVIRCKYHGLCFDDAGHCVTNPHSDKIPPNAHVRAYPVTERYGMVWVWTGHDARADPAQIPDLAYIDDPATVTVYNYIEAQYRVDVLVDNLLDLSHADYLHQGSFSGGPPENNTLEVSEVNNCVDVVFRNFDAPPSPRFAALGERIDTQISIRWHPGNVITFAGRAVKSGGSIDTAEPGRFFHIGTPANAGMTHYFMSTTLSAAMPADRARTIQTTQRHVIDTEDGPMLEAVDLAMEGAELMALHPFILPIDSGGLRARRVMKRLLESEAGQDAARLTV
ncbi:aromatic ring-hydroxylating dioxygenase subunit alpha [Novosphingobium terrae]|uniref:aromatic ring-hydroxylating dioxygenase subunit alpha n=1 Tax=Novosphingobium terrae TaxID=2726189 RepID=UPI00197F88AE|nr:aromatic ring-hydroxylating dioxygenase subunit alpha [Novosphingobium terrae]